MVKPSTILLPPTKVDRRAALWWLTDSIGAIPVAGGIALAVTASTVARQVWPLAAGLLVAGGCVRALAIWRAGIAGQAAAAAMRARLREALHAPLLRSRLRRGRLIGEDMHLAVDSIAETGGLIARFLPLRMASGLSPLLIAAAVAPASWVAALIMLVTLVPFILAMALAGGAAARKAQAQHRALTRLSGLFVDRLRSLPMILTYGAEERITRHLGSAAQDAARRTMGVLGIAFASSAILDFFAALSVALVAVYCGFSLLHLLPFPAPEALTLPRAFYALALAPEFYLAMRRLAAAYHDKQQGEAALAAMRDQLDAISPQPAPFAPPRLWQGRDVMLTHADGASIGPLNWAWTSLGLHAVTGPTGAGKSSLLLALIGQGPACGGMLQADDGAFLPGSLNAHIGWAGQQVALLPGSLRANLIPTPDQTMPDDAELLACLNRLGLGPMLARRGGLDLAVDHRGSSLSGGERRRIGLARAILSQRPILLLDEPTADLDAGTAAAVRALLGELARDRLVVVATHDAALIAMAASVCAVAP
ncbi:ATP-binding cassette domain-containing protein [Novosphingobium rosa]|uniref:ATP-binding cassette domain-containing protein n=1 Tax=Novosphingobium rosa TaxID=76978 RepID=UPI0008307E86|nr:ATP-binding cassette domain-containing protein [Novosphingobium rosa]